MGRANLFWKDIVKKNCFFCGSPPSNIATNRGKIPKTVIYSGIDRLDNSIGYTERNCAPCCKKCNYWKRADSVDTFLQHVRKIYDVQKLSILASA